VILFEINIVRSARTLIVYNAKCTYLQVVPSESAEQRDINSTSVNLDLSARGSALWMPLDMTRKLI